MAKSKAVIEFPPFEAADDAVDGWARALQAIDAARAAVAKQKS
jgi:hypothetical protein